MPVSDFTDEELLKHAVRNARGMHVRKGDWMQTYTGRQFWPLDPRPEEVCIEDIAHALSMICRYNGHCNEFYPVAQHSVLVSDALSEEYKLWGLLHDASEAFVVDVVRPLKPYLMGYKEIEQNVMNAIATRFELPLEIPEEVKRVDNAILADEMAQLMNKPPADWGLTEPPLGVTITPWVPAMAERIFLERFKWLTKTT